jgi:hypothetical protein
MENSCEESLQGWKICKIMPMPFYGGVRWSEGKSNRFFFPIAKK